MYNVITVDTLGRLETFCKPTYGVKSEELESSFGGIDENNYYNA